MGLKIFLLVALPIFLTFAIIAYKNKSVGTYIASVIVSFIYFLAATEGVVFAFCFKIPLVGFLINPYPGKYRFFLHNYKYHGLFFNLLFLLYIIGAVVLYLRFKNKSVSSNNVHEVFKDTPTVTTP